MRATLDKLISWMGLLLAVVLLVAGGLLTWASTFIGGQVDQQLSDQAITMPTEEAINSDEALSDEDRAALLPFAGSEMNTGPEARVYADHFILAHMMHSSDGETYSSMGGVVRTACEDPESQECADATATRASLFQGNTLRGLLLYGYAFATMGTIAGYAAVASFIGAAVLLVLSLLGFRHAKSADEVPVAAKA